MRLGYALPQVGSFGDPDAIAAVRAYAAVHRQTSQPTDPGDGVEPLDAARFFESWRPEAEAGEGTSIGRVTASIACA